MFHLETSTLTHLLASYGYLAVLLFVAIESTVIPFPGETMLLVAAIAAGTTHRLSIAWVIVAAASGAILGDNLGFWVGHEGGYRLMRGFKLPPLMLTEDEALALTLGLLAAKRLGLTMAAPAVEGALAKIDRVLPEALRERVQAVQETLVLDSISTDRYRSSPVSSVVLTLSIATQQEKRIWMLYQSGQAAETERAIDSYGLIFHAGLWYTVAYCHLRQDLRTFRLDRVLEVELLEETFTRPPDFNSLDHLRRSIASMPGTWKVEVMLEMALEEAERQVPPTMAMLESVQGGVVMSCYTQDLSWMAHFLVNLRCSLIVYEPVELHEAMRRLAGEIIQLAKRSEKRSTHIE